MQEVEVVAAAASERQTLMLVPISSSFLSFRGDKLKVEEIHQYPRANGAAASNETEGFSREPFIARFHSNTTRTSHDVGREIRDEGRNQTNHSQSSDSSFATKDV